MTLRVPDAKAQNFEAATVPETMSGHHAGSVGEDCFAFEALEEVASAVGNLAATKSFVGLVSIGRRKGGPAGYVFSAAEPIANVLSAGAKRSVEEISRRPALFNVRHSLPPTLTLQIKVLVWRAFRVDNACIVVLYRLLSRMDPSIPDASVPQEERGEGRRLVGPHRNGSFQNDL